MTSAAKSGFKTQLQYYTATGQKTIAEVLSVDPPERKSGTVDVTNMDSPNVTELISDGIVDGGEVSFSANYVGPTVDAPVSLLLGAVKSTWQIALPDFGASVKSVSSVTGTLHITGHGLLAGTPVQVASTVALPTPLVALTTYYVIVTDADQIQLALTNAAALVPTPISFTDAGSGTITVRVPTRYVFDGLMNSDKLETPLKAQQKFAGKIKAAGAVTIS